MRSASLREDRTAGDTTIAIRRSLVHRTPLLWCLAALATCHAAHGATIYNLSLSGDLSGSGKVVFEDGALDVDGVHDLADVLVSFELTVDAMPAKDDLIATPPITFTKESLVVADQLQYQVQDGVLRGLDIRVTFDFVVGTFIGKAIGDHADEDEDTAQPLVVGGFGYRVDSSSFPLFRCDPRVEDCRATLSAKPVPEPSTLLLGALAASTILLVKRSLR